MSDALNNLVQVSISAQTAGITRKGFGTPLIATYHDVFPERVRAYTDPGDMITDGFTAGHAAYRIASAIMSQVPAPPSFLVGRCAETPVPHVETFTPTAVEGVTYYVDLADADGVVVTYEYECTTGKTATDICGALVTAINLEAPDVTASGTSTLVLTGDNDGEVFAARAYTSISSADQLLWGRVNSTADYGIATDLAAIAAVRNDWFGLIVDNQSELIINAAAAWAETNRKLLAFTSGDTLGITGAAAGGDVFDDQEVASRAFTFGVYSDSPHEHAAAALMGRIFPLKPGQATWAHKTLRNVSAQELSATHRSNLEAKNGNWYCSVSGKAITFPGMTGLDFIDVSRTVEWVKTRWQEDVFLALSNADKQPFTDKGIGAVEAAMRGVWIEGIGNGALNDDLALTMPLADDVSAADKAARTLTGVKANGTVAGAIHTVEIQGTISAA